MTPFVLPGDPTMALFALSLLIGGLIALIDQSHPEVRKTILGWAPQNHRQFLFASTIAGVGGVALYVVLWVHYFDIAAPSSGFRVFSLFRRAIQILPLMLAAMVVGFEAFRWIRRASTRGQAHVIPHGIGVAGSGLLVIGMFIMQDARLFSSIHTVNTPVLSLEFKLNEPVSPLQVPHGVIERTEKTGSLDDDPVTAALIVLSSLSEWIRRDIKYALLFSDPPDREKIATPDETRFYDALRSEKTEIPNEIRFYEDAVKPIAQCLIAIRQRVRDTDSTVFVDKDLGRYLRVAHRLRLSEDSQANLGFSSELGKLTRLFPDLFRKIQERQQQHKYIVPVFDAPSDLTSCDRYSDVQAETSRLLGEIRRNEDLGGFSPETPYFTLMVASLLHIMNETSAAVEEIDAWIERKNRKSLSQTHIGGAKAEFERMMSMRANYVAANWLSNDPKFATVSIRYYRRALDLIEDSFIHANDRNIKRMTLATLFDEMNLKKDAWLKSDSQCRTLPPDLRTLVFAALGMINSTIFFAVDSELTALDVDLEHFVRDHYEVLGFVEPTCFDGTAVSRSPAFKDALAAFTDTYLLVKLAMLRPCQRIAFVLRYVILQEWWIEQIAISHGSNRKGPSSLNRATIELQRKS